MLREANVHSILPNKSRKDPLRAHRSEAAMATTTVVKPSGMKRDVSEVVCHSCKEKGNNAQVINLSLRTLRRHRAPRTQDAVAFRGEREKEIRATDSQLMHISLRTLRHGTTSTRRGSIQTIECHRVLCREHHFVAVSSGICLVAGHLLA